jgi:hypothetical protein
VLPVAGAGISMFSGKDIRVPIGASDPDSAEAESLQFTVGEGPCLAAHRSHQPVVAPGPELATRWPDFHQRLLERTPFRSILAFPLREELTGLASIDLYCHGELEVCAVAMSDVQVLARLITGKVLDDELFAGAATEPAWLETPPVIGRNRVLIAAGMISMARALPTEDSLGLLRRYASAHHRTADEVSAGIVSRMIPINEIRLGPSP